MALVLSFYFCVMRQEENNTKRKKLWSTNFWKCYKILVYCQIIWYIKLANLKMINKLKQLSVGNLWIPFNVFFQGCFCTLSSLFVVYQHFHGILCLFSRTLNLIFFISWRLITSQHFSGFCHTLTWISHGVTCIPPPPPPSPPNSSGFSQCTRSERLSHASHLGWWSVSL